ncbi:MAG: DNA helicase RecQ [Thermoanaerobaculaceae bacterium]|nr:DNA helicase RecQ [Thermoanaerobaculaceae bacterium]
MGKTPGIAADLESVLRSVFGYTGFRPLQREVMERVIGGGDAFVLMPTGGGKSLCYQVPALVRPGTAVVVSPLISLMKDQVDALRANGVAAERYDSSLDQGEARRVLARLHAGELDLLYVSPERLMTDAFLERLRPLEIALFAIDEAHCVSQWGHDFRPEYIALGKLRTLFSGVPLLALTATADATTRGDVQEKLGLLGAPVFAAGFDRPNIRYTVVEKNKPVEQLLGFLGPRRGDAGIVYCLTRKRTEEVAARIGTQGIAAAAYHAGLPSAERTAVQDRFLRDELQVVVATVAFGMGIDKPDVRFVVHYDMPKSIEGYYQESGRAGRDGMPAEALLLFGMQDVVTARRLVEGGGDPDQVRVELHKLNAMVAFAESLGCRRRALLGYFGEALERDCGNCDVCLDPPERYDGTEQAQKALSCVYRVGQRFGARHVVDVLRGADTARVRDLGHDRLTTYGIGRDLPADAWMGVIRQLVHLGYLFQDIASYSVLKLTPAATPVLRGERRVELAVPRESRRPGGARRARQTADGLAVDEALFERLRALRRRLSDQQGVPAYVVFSDATLAAMAALRPTTLEGLRRVSGVGEAKLARYGGAFLAVLTGA